MVGPKGIYTIETKTLSKPARGQCVITVSGDEIRANGRLIERSATVQAKAQARWLHNFFGESDFKTFVQPVVVFPGWYVEKFDTKAAGVWALEPKCLEGFLERQPDISRRKPFARAGFGTWQLHHGSLTALSSASTLQRRVELQTTVRGPRARKGSAKKQRERPKEFKKDQSRAHRTDAPSEL